MKAIAGRPHVQGSGAGLGLETTREMLTGGSGLLPIRALWDRLDVGKWIDTKLSWSRKEYWPSLLIEQWILLLLYGGDRMDHLPMLKSGRIDRLFGWKAVVAPTTF